MQQKEEIYFVTIIGIILGLLLVSFIVAMLVLYKRRQQRQEQEMAIIKDKFEKEVLRSQLEIQENTFKTISQELHDNIGQMLSVVKLSLSGLPIEKDHPAYPLANQSLVLLNKAILDLSGVTKSLYTDRVIDDGLTVSIRNELAIIRNVGLVKVKFSVNGPEVQLQDQKIIFLYRIFQESLNNALKHSKAAYIFVTLSNNPDNIFVMSIEDNGIGFDKAKKGSPTSSGKGVGLKSMFNRAKMIGADIEIISGIDEGTRLIVKLPLENE